ncbi:MAG: cobalamin biosynthesis protein [Candidatus Omnitrophica bacterium]|nr:cobalamin biosynthesis protein [Candidatus Omnitrophota bacterium]
MKTITKLWAGLGILILLSPLGLLLPEHFKAQEAWGEWGTDRIKEMVGYIPRGLEKFSGLWQPPIPDYGQEQGASVLGYMLSALFGIIIVVAIIFLFAKFLSKKDNL